MKVKFDPPVIVKSIEPAPSPQLSLTIEVETVKSAVFINSTETSSSQVLSISVIIHV